MRYTRAAIPSTPTVVSGWNQTDGSYIEVTINGGANPTGTEYLVDVSTISDFSNLISSGQLTTNDLRLTNLEAGVIYYVRTRARNEEGYLTEWSGIDSAKTPPPAPGWINVTADVDIPALRFEWEEVSDATTYKFYASTGDVVIVDTTTWTLTDLKYNTSYWGYVRPVSAEGEGSGTEAVVGWTKIETPEGVEFVEISSDSIKVRATGTFTNATLGESAVQFKELKTGVTSNWLLTTDDFRLTSLQPNTEYSFKARARNKEGLETSWNAIEVSTYTLAEEPLAPSLSEPTTYSLRVTINRGNNPKDTEYCIYNNELQKYVQADGGLGDVEVWLPYRDVLGDDWGGSGGIEVTGLQKDSAYTFKVRARNKGGFETGWSEDSEQGITSPYAVIVECLNRAEGEWTNVAIVSFTVTGSDHYHYRFNQNAADTAQTTDTQWDGSTMTLTMAAQGDWYLHVRGENAADGLLGTDTFGPIRFDNKAPEITGISCYYDVTMTTEITSGQWTDWDKPYFVWTEPLSTAPIAGYSILWTTSPTLQPDNNIDKNIPTYDLQLTTSGIYYLRVKAKDEAGNWGGYTEFEYRYIKSGQSPEIESVDTNGVKEGEVYIGVPAGANPEVGFNVEIDSKTLEGKVVLRAIRNNYGDKGLWEVNGTITYNSETKSIVFEPSGELLKNYTYELVIYEGIKDVLGNEISSSTVITFTTLMDPTEYNVIVGEDEKTKVKIEAGAVSVESYVKISTDVADIQSQIEEANGKIGDMYQYVLEGRKFEIYDKNHSKITSNFNAPVEVELPYSDDDNDGIVDDSVAGDVNRPVKVATLAIYYLNETENKWEEVPNSRVNEDRKVVIARVEHFSYYAIMGKSSLDVSDAKAYPVPWHPGDVPAGETKEGIKFEVSASDCTIRIYTVSGEKVTEIKKSGTDPVWNVETEGGEPVASGVYIYVIEASNGSKKTGKLIVIR